MASGSLTAPNKTRDVLDHTRFTDFTKALRGLPPSYVPGSHLDPLVDSQLPNNGTLMWNKNVEESNVSQFTCNSVNTPNENGDGAEKLVSSEKFRYIKFARFVIALVFIAVTIMYQKASGPKAGCTGSIPESVVSSIDEITCRPVLQNQTEADEAEVKISKEVLVCNDSLNCSFDCSGDNQDRYYSDPKFCNIFHRCEDDRLYTAPCSKRAYFSTQACVCSHIDDVIKEMGCDRDGMRLNVENVKTLCTDSTGS
uniref:Chitin-binding type-2 domain-containing protein n=1 Tax=Magallana gigas TaxID=29159 RepID=A0A8W8IJV0_MAGGI